MHPLHDYVAKQLADKLKDRGVVVWYDEPGEFRAFVDEVRGGPVVGTALSAVVVGTTKATLVDYTGSMFEVRSVVEPLVSGDKPKLLVIYIAGVTHDTKTSVLMELEKAGRTWKPELKQLARNVLLQKYTLGVVDEMLPYDRKVTYQDLARAAADDSGAEPPSILKSIFHGVNGSDGLLTAWLVSDARDAEIAKKDATRELTKLVNARLGLALAAEEPLTKLRAITQRYLLAGEFRLALSCPAPESLASIAAPATKSEESALRDVVRRLRDAHADEYAALADRVETELGLNGASLPPGALGAVDTFRFEERALLGHAGELIVKGEFDAALKVVGEREQSFWLDRDVNRKAQWEAVRRMAELGQVAKEVSKAVAIATGDAAVWLDAYATQSGSGWFRVDQAQRRLEAWIANLDEEPEEHPLAMVRRRYEDTVHAMAEGFTKALQHAKWAVPSALHQTRVWTEVVADRPKPVAYFLVDAMRFEMGVELTERLPTSSEFTVRAAVGALPSITPIGMAALMPGASASFAVVEVGGKLGAQIDDAFLPDLPARKRHAAARVPKIVDLSLDDLLGTSVSKLVTKIGDAQVVLVRSQEIDHAGETGFTFQARQVMDNVLDNLARALRKLSSAGVEQAVISADHGHLFFATDRNESMRTDAPGGGTIELHRRCWIGRGGATSPGCVRVAASALGYASNLEFVFPKGAGVFRAGGDLAFHHGGTSLQEMIVPVITVRTLSSTSGGAASANGAGGIEVTGIPAEITNRIFTVVLKLAPKQIALGADGDVAVEVRPLLMAGGKQVGTLGMALGATFDKGTGILKLESNKSISIAFLLRDESATTVRIVVQDPATDAELFRSATEIPVRLGI